MTVYLTYVFTNVYLPTLFANTYLSRLAELSPWSVKISLRNSWKSQHITVHIVEWRLQLWIMNTMPQRMLCSTMNGRWSMLVENMLTTPLRISMAAGLLGQNSVHGLLSDGTNWFIEEKCSQMSPANIGHYIQASRVPRFIHWLFHQMNKGALTDVDGILQKGPYPTCLHMADRALLAGYPRCVMYQLTVKSLI